MVHFAAGASIPAYNHVVAPVEPISIERSAGSTSPSSTTSSPTYTTNDSNLSSPAFTHEEAQQHVLPPCLTSPQPSTMSSTMMPPPASAPTPPTLTSSSAPTSTTSSVNNEATEEQMNLHHLTQTPSLLELSQLSTPSPTMNGLPLNLCALLPKKTKHGRIGGSLYRALKDAGIDVSALGIPRGRPPRRKVGQKRQKRSTLLSLIKSGQELPRLPRAPEIPFIYPLLPSSAPSSSSSTTSTSSSSASEASSTPTAAAPPAAAIETLQHTQGTMKHDPSRHSYRPSSSTDPRLRDVTNRRRQGERIGVAGGQQHHHAPSPYHFISKGGGQGYGGAAEDDPTSDECDDEESLVLGVLTSLREG